MESIKAKLSNYEVTICKNVYTKNKALALEAFTEYGEPFAILSVNLPESGMLPKNQCFFKTWSENEGFMEQLIEQGLIKELNQTIQSGFVSTPLVEVLF